MRLIDKYICKEVFSHALVGLLIFTFVLFVPKLITADDHCSASFGFAGQAGPAFSVRVSIRAYLHAADGRAGRRTHRTGPHVRG